MDTEEGSGTRKQSGSGRVSRTRTEFGFTTATDAMEGDFL